MPSRFYKNVIALSKTPADFTTTEVIEITKATTVVDDPKTTVVHNLPTTVVDKLTTTVVDEAAGSTSLLWQAELNGALFPSSRVRRIELAQDALTHAEECVYDYLWGPKNTAKDESRLAQAGYDRIAKIARITKRNAALILGRLIEKGFVTLERPADPLHRIPSQYRVLGYKAALEELSRRQRRWVVRSGNGVLFVHPAVVSMTTVAHEATTTVVPAKSTTVVADQSTTVAATTTDTVVVEQPTTVVATTTLLDSRKESERQTSSSLADICSKAGIVLDAAAEKIIFKRCRAYDRTATTEEIDYFTAIKINQLRTSRNIGNFVGLLMTAIPEYFVPPAHELQRYRAGKAQQVSEQQDLARKILKDPGSTDEEREWAQSTLAITVLSDEENSKSD